MRRTAVITLLLALAVASSRPVPVQAKDPGVPQTSQADKAAQKKQTALYNYQKKQAQAQQKAQRKADKQQQKAAKKYEKQQRKMLKNASIPAKHKS